jgi:hypothetical protein
MRSLFIFLLTSLIVSCRQFDPAKDRTQLLAMHREQREAHLNKNAQQLVSQLADDFISVNHGLIDSLFSRQQYQARFQRYFDAVNFKKSDDVAHPKIFFSEDHSLAYMVVDKIVVLETKDENGSLVEERTHFAWVAILRKDGSKKWKVECIASTNEPEGVRKL